MKNPNYIAFIPARGGSKSIPMKNIKEISGKPLVYWVAKAAQDCSAIDEIYIATDSEEIADTALNFKFSKLKVVGRSPITSSDQASTESVVEEFSGEHFFGNMVLIQATSPLLASEDIYNGINRFISMKYDSLLSLVRQKRFHWVEESGFVKPQNYDYNKRPKRQEFRGQLIENGAFYIFSRKGFLENKCRLFGKIGWIEMDARTYYELDEQEDFDIVEQLLIKKNQNNAPLIKRRLKT